MKKYIENSFSELKNLRSITGAGILCALDVVLGLVATIRISAKLQIGFAYLAMSAIGAIYGPVMGFFCGCITDIVKYVIMPDGGFMPLFTLIEAMGGFLYGLVLYKKEISFWRCLTAKALVSAICNILMTPLALQLLYGSNFVALMMTRVPKNLILLIPESILMYLVLRTLKKIREGISFK